MCAHKNILNNIRFSHLFVLSLHHINQLNYYIMATKTWKIGEYAKGGIITVETTKKAITVIGKEWDYSKGTRSSSDQSKAEEFTRRVVTVGTGNTYRELYMFLSDLTTSYYAETIIDWCKTKVDINKNLFGSVW
jgi:hypothetical protein